MPTLELPMTLNAALVLTLLLCTVAAAVGFWLGRRSAKFPTRGQGSRGRGRINNKLAAASSSSDTEDTGVTSSARATRDNSVTTKPASARRPSTTSDSLRLQIEDRLDHLRRARENAEPWAAPSVDRVRSSTWPLDLPTRPMVFADTTIDPQAMH